jgi:hypothetical protein
MTSNDPWGPFDRLRERIQETLEPLDVELVTWALLPGSRDGEPKAAQVILRIGDDAFKSEEDREFDQQFKDITRAERHHAAMAEGENLVKEFLIDPKDDTPES